MSDIRIISTEKLSGKALHFALLHNALLQAGYDSNVALDYPAKVIGQQLSVECDCKK